VSGKAKINRRRPAGKGRATQIEEPPMSAVLCVGESDEPLVDAVRRRLSDPKQLVVVRSVPELRQVQEELFVATFFGMGTGAVGLEAHEVLASVRRSWPAARRLWFARRSAPALPRPVPPLLTGVQTWGEPYARSKGRLADRVAAESEAGLTYFRGRVDLARMLVADYALPPKAAKVCAAIALWIPERRWVAFAGFENDQQLGRYLSRALYRRFAVSDRLTLLCEVLRYCWVHSDDARPE